MKKVLLIALLGFTQCLMGQISNPPYIPVSSAPFGICGIGFLDQQVTTGGRYYCNGGIWAEYGSGSGSGTVTSVAETVPAWEGITGSPITTSGTLAIAAATGQTSHQVVGTCNAATTVGLCSLVAGDLPSSITSNTSGTSAGLAPLETHTASSSASLSFTTAFSTSCTAYEVVVAGLIPSTSSVIYYRFNSDTSSSYSSVGVANSNGSVLALPYYTNTLGVTVYAADVPASNFSWNGSFLITDAASTAIYKSVSGALGTKLATAGFYSTNFTGIYLSTTAITSMQVVPSTGSLTSGTVSIYCRQ
jgi:hypothetical protein